MPAALADAARWATARWPRPFSDLHNLPERPDADQTRRLMSAFAPHRTLATMHLGPLSRTLPKGYRHEKNIWSLIESRFQKFAAWVDEEGPAVALQSARRRCRKIDPEAENNARKLAEVQRQVTQYANGKRRDFDLELAAEGPEFDKKVWSALLEIPFGTTTSYGAVAKRIGHPTAARAVGRGQRRQPHRPDRALPSGDRQRRQSYRLWRRLAAEAQAVWNMRRTFAARAWTCSAEDVPTSRWWGRYFRRGSDFL